MQGRIVKIISNDYTILSNDKRYVCKARGKFRNDKITPMVGDIVSFDEEKKYITKIEDRDNYLLRPFVSNVDICLIVTSVIHPNFSPYLLDKLITIVEYNKIKPVICFTKLDLLDDKKEIKTYINYYKKIGYKVYINTQIDEIKKLFKNKIVVFTGQSGSGKSTLLNRIDPSLNLKTDEISYALGRGKHTTRHVELISLNQGLVADTPGFSSVDFKDMDKVDIKNSFREFKDVSCPFKDCMHNKEKECKVKQLVKEGKILKSRYENYLKFIGE